MSSRGQRIIDGLKEAIAGDFAAVTIDGVRWVRAGCPEPEGGNLQKMQIRSPEGWRDIATCPDWSGSVLVWINDQYGGYSAVAQKDDTDVWIYGPQPGRSFEPIDEPAFWRPLPSPPSPEGPKP
jgi:hypothetical protein